MSRAPETRTPGGNRANAAEQNEHADSKQLRTLQARAALAGFELLALTSGGFLLCRWGKSRELPDLRAAAQALRFMGVK